MSQKENTKELHECDECNHVARKYADGYIYRDWSGCFNGDAASLPTVPDQSKYWTYVECKKNGKKLTHLNLDGTCVAFQKKK